MLDRELQKADRVSRVMTPVAPWRAAGGRRPRDAASRGVRLLLAVGLLTAAFGLVPAGPAAAASPSIAITSPTDGSVTNDPTPTFSGTTDDPFEELTEDPNEITISVYAGTSVSDAPVQTPVTMTPGAEKTTWSLGLVQALAPGTYTAQAEQRDFFLGTGTSQPVTFTVDTAAPTVSLTSPANGSTTTGSSASVAGSAGTAAGDSSVVTVHLYAGPQVGQQPLESVSVQRSGEAWSAVLGGLVAGGSYVVQADQGDGAGNVGVSPPVGFTVATLGGPPAPTLPQASFRWFPAVPRVGEQVSLVSSSTDAGSALTAFAWSLAPTGSFAAGKPVLTTVFRSPGTHTVRLQVTAADGLSSTATGAVRVLRAHIALMQPFPVVRIAGILRASGVDVGLLTAQVPVGARVTVSCRGGACPARSETRLAASGSRRGGETLVLVRFRDFQRYLRAGTVLEIRISKRGRIGKYTRFAIRRGLPRRSDRCLSPTGSKPIACPSS